MVTGHFGLDEGPFHGKAEGSTVYLGPQQAPVIARLGKNLSRADTVLTVTGPVGVGKTTLVRHALSEVSGRKIIIPVDRIRLAPDEVLDLLLARFNTSREPHGTIQRVAAFRRLLHEQLEEDTRVFIVVEDAERIGIDALLELEALTATDSGDSAGANIVLMGSSGMPAFLATPALVRLRQRVRLRQTIAAFTAPAVTEYMRHRLEVAGGIFEQIFEAGTGDVVWRYTGGVARLVDNLCESALESAAEAGLATILPEFLQEVAETCGFDALAPEVPANPAREAPATGAEPASAAAPGTLPASGDDAAPLVVPGAPPKLALVTSFAAESPGTPFNEVRPGLVERFEASASANSDCSQEPDGPGDALPGDEGEEIPTLSDSMRINVLPVAAMEASEPLAKFAREAKEVMQVPVCDGSSDLEDTAEAEALPDPDQWPAEETAAAPGSRGQSTDIAPDRSPSTLIDECAGDSENEEPVVVPLVSETAHGTRDSDNGDALDPDVTTEAEALSLEEQTPTAPGFSIAAFDEQSELTGDVATDVFVGEGIAEPELDALQAAIQASNAWQADEIAETAAGQVNASSQQRTDAGSCDAPPITPDRSLEKPAAGASDRFADELGKARNLEDISDMLAETLFGSEELQTIGAELQGTQPVTANQPAPVPVASAPAPEPSAISPPPSKPAVAHSRAGSSANPTGFNMTVSQRIDMLNSLNKGKPAMRQPEAPVTEIVLGETPEPPADGPAPESIEAQIDTAITQTRKVLTEAEIGRLAAQDRGNDGGSRGLFGLFRRSKPG